MQATSTAALVDAVGTIQSNITDNVLAILPIAIGIIGLVLGLSLGLKWLLNKISNLDEFRDDIYTKEEIDDYVDRAKKSGQWG